MADAIVARALTRRFGSFTAVDGVAFGVRAGEIFGLLGPNGAGKTTVIRMLTGLLAPTAGEAVVAGVDVGRDPRGVRERIGYMSQLFSLYGDLTVEENIEFFGGLYGVGGARFAARRDWVLAMAGLGDLRRWLTATLPLGHKQRLALGCALLHEPPVVFLDEPTSGVDPLARRAFWDLIYGLAARGTTVLVTTHYMEEAEYCDRLALMHRGLLVAVDTPDALRAGLGDRILAVTADDPLAAVGVLGGVEGVREVSLFGRTVHVVMAAERADAAAVATALARAGIRHDPVSPISPSLEDVFMALVGRAGPAEAA